MKGMFPEFDDRADTDYAAIWNEALFVFDTNMLLNLYRYQTSTSDKLLSILDKLQKQIWIPYQVALEYQRSRRSVIAAQHETFSSVRKTIESVHSDFVKNVNSLNLRKRHHPFDLDELEKKVSDIKLEYLEKLNNLHNERPDLNGKDNIKKQLEDLFKGRVGAPPTNQDFLNKLQTAIEDRFKNKMPPGYKDENKEKKISDTDIFTHRGLNYKAKCGDAILWLQILEYAAKEKKKTIIFVTDDAKEDWWLKFKIEGGKTIGPRPELIEEARRVGGIEHFYMYSSDIFLERAAEFLKVEDATISDMVAEVRDLTEQDYSLAIRATDPFKWYVFHWLANFNEQVREHVAFDFVTKSNNGEAGYEIYTNTSGISIRSSWQALIALGSTNIIKYNLKEFNFIFPVRSKSEALNILKEISSPSLLANTSTEFSVNIIFGTLRNNLGEVSFEMISKHPVEMIGKYNPEQFFR